MSAKQKYPHTCYFCKAPIDRSVRGNRYVFPVPLKYSLHPQSGGVYACPKCSPVIYAEQEAEGQLLVQDPSR